MSDDPDVTKELGPQEVELRRATETTQLPLIATASRPSQLALIFVAVAAASFLVGIAVSAAMRPSSEEEVVASERIGPDGGTVRFEGGQLHIPEGALNGVEEITISRSVVKDALRVGGVGVIEPGEVAAYTFEPTNVAFRETAELTFRLPEGARNGSVFARRGRSILLLSGVVDIDRGTATIELGGFSFR